MKKPFLLLTTALLWLSACKPKVDDPTPVITNTETEPNIKRNNKPGNISESIIAKDGNIVVVGMDANEHPMIAEISINSGAILWSKTFSDTAVGAFAGIAVSSNGYMICGVKQSDRGDYDVHITHVDEQGEMIWHTGIGSPNEELMPHITATTGNNFVITAAQKNTTYDILDIWVTEDGGPWMLNFEAAGEQIPYNVICTSDKNILITGTDNETIVSSGKMYMLSLNGFLSQTFKVSRALNNKHTMAKQTIELNNQSLIVCGSVSAGGKCNAFITKTNSNGQEVWRNEYSSDSNMLFTTILADGEGFKAAGYLFNSSPDATSEAILVSVDGEGKELWRKKYSNQQNIKDEVVSILPRKDGSYVLLCNSTDINNTTSPDYQYFLMSIDKDGKAVQ